MGIFPILGPLVVWQSYYQPGWLSSNIPWQEIRVRISGWARKRWKGFIRDILWWGWTVWRVSRCID